MIDTGAELRAVILDDESITDIVGSRVWVETMPHAATSTWQRPDQVQPSILITVEGANTDNEPRIDCNVTIIFLGPSPDSARDLTTTVIDTFDRTRGQTTDTAEIVIMRAADGGLARMDPDTGWQYVETKWFVSVGPV